SRSRLREAEVLDLALGDQLLHGTGDIFDRYVRVDPVLIKKVDRLDAQPLQCRISHLADMLGTGVETVARAVRIDTEAELGRDHHLVAERRECLAEQRLVRKGSVSLSRVEQSHTSLDGGAED